MTPRRRAEQALVAVIGRAYVEGVDPAGRRPGESRRWASTAYPARRSPGWQPDKRQSRTAPSGDTLGLRAAYRYVWVDAFTPKGPRSRSRRQMLSAVVATAVNHQGQREIVGFDIVSAEDTAAWTEFLRGLVARGLTGVELVISDAHGGIKAAIATVRPERHLATLPDAISHGNLASRVPKAELAPMIAALVRSIFELAAITTPPGNFGQARRRRRQADHRRLLRRGTICPRRGRRHPGRQRLPRRALAEDPF